MGSVSGNHRRWFYSLSVLLFFAAKALKQATAKKWKERRAVASKQGDFLFVCVWKYYGNCKRGDVDIMAECNYMFICLITGVCSSIGLIYSSVRPRKRESLSVMLKLAKKCPICYVGKPFLSCWCMLECDTGPQGQPGVSRVTGKTALRPYVTWFHFVTKTRTLFGNFSMADFHQIWPPYLNPCPFKYFRKGFSKISRLGPDSAKTSDIDG